MLAETLDVFLCPSPARILALFGGWDYEGRLRPQLRQLQRLHLLERQGDDTDRRYRLASLGQLRCLGGIDPEVKWQRPWDGQWRILIFDLPTRPAQVRQRLWRWLRAQKFGCLQRSAWVTPDKIVASSLPLADLAIKAESVTILGGHPQAPVLDSDLVGSAWDFELINELYGKVLELAADGQRFVDAGAGQQPEFRRWLHLERQAWLAALSVDPLLPEALLPRGYQGRQAKLQRNRLFGELAKRTVAMCSKA